MQLRQQLVSPKLQPVLLLTPSPPDSTTTESTAQTATARLKGGRPVKSTDKRKKDNELAIIASKNEIASIFAKEKKLSGKKRLPRGRLGRIIAEVKVRNNLLDDTIIKSSCIRSRVKKQRTSVLQSHPGTPSPLLAYEMEFVSVLIQMARMRESLSPTESMSLINDVIKGTQAQIDLVHWKKKHSYGDSDVLGVGYWNKFKQRNGHLICSKRGQKYELDRDKWTTYANFKQMYSHNYLELVDAGLAMKLDTPVWMDEKGTECEEHDGYGCMVDIVLKYPEMAFVMDEVGGGTSQKGDGHIGGKLRVCGKGMEVRQKINTKEKRWTLLGLTSLNGEPVMCIIIFAGIREQAIYETGIDIFCKQEGEVSDKFYFINNSGPGKRFPGGPTCSFRGKEIPCLTRWSPKGSITSQILIDILVTSYTCNKSHSAILSPL